MAIFLSNILLKKGKGVELGAKPPCKKYISSPRGGGGAMKW